MTSISPLLMQVLSRREVRGGTGERRPGFHRVPGWRASPPFAFHRASRLAWRGRLSSASLSERMRRSRLAVSMGSSRSGTGMGCGNTGSKSREPRCAEPPAPCPIPRPFLRPAEVHRRKPLQRINERKSRKAILLFFQSLLQPLRQARREALDAAKPQLHDDADGGDDDEAATATRRGEESVMRKEWKCSAAPPRGVSGQSPGRRAAARWRRGAARCCAR